MEGDTMHREEGSSGSLIGIIIILLVIVLGGLYFWIERTKEVEMSDDQIDAINTQSASDETADIQADLDATNIDSIDADL